MAGAPDIITSSQQFQDRVPEIGAVWALLAAARAGSEPYVQRRAQDMLKALSDREVALEAKAQALRHETVPANRNRNAALKAFEDARKLVRELSLDVALTAARDCWGEDPARDRALNTLGAELWSARTGCGSASKVLSSKRRRGAAASLDRYDACRYAEFFAARAVTSSSRRELWAVAEAAWTRVGGEPFSEIERWVTDDAVKLETGRVSAELQEVLRTKGEGQLKVILETVLFRPRR